MEKRWKVKGIHFVGLRRSMRGVQLHMEESLALNVWLISDETAYTRRALQEEAKTAEFTRKKRPQAWVQESTFQRSGR